MSLRMVRSGAPARWALLTRAHALIVLAQTRKGTGGRRRVYGGGAHAWRTQSSSLTTAASARALCQVRTRTQSMHKRISG